MKYSPQSYLFEFLNVIFKITNVTVICCGKEIVEFTINVYYKQEPLYTNLQKINYDSL